MRTVGAPGRCGETEQGPGERGAGRWGRRSGTASLGDEGGNTWAGELGEAEGVPRVAPPSPAAPRGGTSTPAPSRPVPPQRVPAWRLLAPGHVSRSRRAGVLGGSPCGASRAAQGCGGCVRAAKR